MDIFDCECTFLCLTASFYGFLIALIKVKKQNHPTFVNGWKADHLLMPARVKNVKHKYVCAKCEVFVNQKEDHA